ncbi:hypothetical protein ALC60_07733, partial [Trachymyrmex zeteki]
KKNFFRNNVALASSASFLTVETSRRRAMIGIDIVDTTRSDNAPRVHLSLEVFARSKHCGLASRNGRSTVE